MQNTIGTKIRCHNYFIAKLTFSKNLHPTWSLMYDLSQRDVRATLKYLRINTGGIFREQYSKFRL